MKQPKKIYKVLNTKAGRKAFLMSENTAELNGKVIKCPDCPNSSADKILSNSAEVLTASKEAHFGCCECGTAFILRA